MSSDIPLNAIKPFDQNVSCVAIVIDGGENRQTASGSVTTFRVADLTGSINVSFINPEFRHTFTPGDIVRITGGYGAIYSSRLHLGIRQGECKKIGDFTMVFNDSPNISEKLLPDNLKDPRDQHHRDKKPSHQRHQSSQYRPTFNPLAPSSGHQSRKT